MPRPYPREFREGALELVRQGDRPVAEIAGELGIAESCLRRWMKQEQLDRRVTPVVMGAEDTLSYGGAAAWRPSDPPPARAGAKIAPV